MDLFRAQQAAMRCDVLLVIGPSLGVQPAAGLVPLAVHHGAQLIILNGEATPYDHMAAVVLRQVISKALPAIIPG
jgi:NAD-dependent deacetylase